MMVSNIIDIYFHVKPIFQMTYTVSFGTLSIVWHQDPSHDIDVAPLLRKNSIQIACEKHMVVGRCKRTDILEDSVKRVPIPQSVKTAANLVLNCSGGTHGQKKIEPSV